jgi:hypothetical protein
VCILQCSPEQGWNRGIATILCPGKPLRGGMAWSVAMKKLAILTGVFSLFPMGCDDVLSAVTVNENGEKVFHNIFSNR